ncbi:hypothetical protein GF354_00075 [Candidatus Peregrinibacteria bacterium]|nr:hypothetical protein [Candidatus Peregrinibacteria bacterium]
MEKFYKIMNVPEFRSTASVKFNRVPMLPGLTAITRVEHEVDAFSPGSVGEIKRPWYMHQNQEDNLLVLHGSRFVELFHKDSGEVLKFEIGPDFVNLNGKKVHKGPAVLHWDTFVFHRVHSRSEGSMSLNFAVRSEGFDIRTNFDIYDLNTDNGEHTVIRKGFEDQQDTD